MLETPEAKAFVEKKVLVGVLGIVLGGLGIHKFILGFQKEGIIMLLVSLIGGMLTLGFAAYGMAVIGLIEGIIYITKTDEDFYQTYGVQKKTWF